MGTVPSQYIVIQQAEWAGRKFYTAHDQRADQAVYLMQEPPRGRFSAPQHPSLPKLQPLVVDADAGWLIGTPPVGETLEDLRSQGVLSEQDMLSMLLSVADGLAELAALQPPVVPSYLDPACIKRDSLGRWVLDYLLLAQAPEVRKPSAPPPGIYAFGVLLYWLFTGQTARMTRVQVRKVEGIPPALQFIMVRCLGRSYPGLAELRADIERAGHEKDFRGVAQSITKQREPTRTPEPAAKPAVTVPPSAPQQEARPAMLDAARQTVPESPGAPKTQRLFPDPWAAWEEGEHRSPALEAPTEPKDPPVTRKLPLEYRKVPLGGPHIPVDDRPWALPARPEDGFRQYVVPPPPDPLVRKLYRWGTLTLIGLTTLVLSGWVVVRTGLLPEAMLPGFLKAARPVSQYPNLARASAEIGRELPTAPPAPGAVPVPDMARDDRAEMLAFKRAVRQGLYTVPAPAPAETPPAPPPGPVSPPPGATKPPDRPPTPPTQPGPPAPEPVPVPAPPEPEKPEPAFFAMDARTGAMPIQIYIDGRLAGHAYLFPHPSSPYISLQAFNHFFRGNVYWVPADGVSVRLFAGDRSLLTRDYSIVQGRLWLKLSSALQESLDVQVSAYSDGVMYFTTQ